MNSSRVWDKRKLHKLLVEALKAEREATLLAAETAKEGATHEDAVAKSKYDTHGLELSYLAGSQFERARLAETKIIQLENTAFRAFDTDETIDIGALVSLRDKRNSKGQLRYYLISTVGAGLSITYEDAEVIVLSPESPLGEALFSLGVGDELPSANPAFKALEIVALA